MVHATGAQGIAGTGSVSRETLKMIVYNYSALQEGKAVYLVSIDWWGAFEKASRFILQEIPVEQPTTKDRVLGVDLPAFSPVTNESLFHPGSKRLKSGLLEHTDYKVISEQQWELLHALFGGTAVKVPVKKSHSRGLFLELEPLKFEVHQLECNTPKASELEPILTIARVSKTSTVAHLQQTVLWSLGYEPRVHLIAGSRLLIIRNDGAWTRICENKALQLDALDLPPLTKLIIEFQNERGVWPCSILPDISLIPLPNAIRNLATSQSGGSVPVKYSSTVTAHQFATNTAPQGQGICGLTNLGNTCFMNSALQCLSNTPPLTEYFVSQAYKADVNTTNPLGMKGELVGSFADLICQMWENKTSSVSPSDFKLVVGRFAPQFRGYQQHDSQEFAAFLLDGLHEDLNRVKVKPYVETSSTDGVPDEEAAVKAWSDNALRNNSKILDLFQGQFKSTVTCPDCSKVSVTFDPFVYLSVPMPDMRDKCVRVLFFPANEHPPTMMNIFTYRHGNFATLHADAKNILASQLNYEVKGQLVSCDVMNRRLLHIQNDHTLLSHVYPSDTVYMFDVAPPKNCTGPFVFISTPVGAHQPLNSKYTGLTNSFEPHKTAQNPAQTPAKKSNNEDGGGNKNNVFMLLPVNMKMHHDVEISRVRLDAVGHPFVLPVNAENTTPEQLFELVDERLRWMVADTEQTVPAYSLHLSKQAVVFDLLDSKISRESTQPIVFTPKSVLVVVWEKMISPPQPFWNDHAGIVKHESLNQTATLPAVSLEKCLELFSTEEKLGPDNEWYCPVCKEHKRATVKMQVWRLPKFLIVHLKRFQHTQFNRCKLDVLVDFPVENLSLPPSLVANPAETKKFDLYAVSNHVGGLYGGHYTAHAINQPTKSWWFFNDSRCSKVANVSDVVTSCAYLLFYKTQAPTDEE